MIVFRLQRESRGFELSGKGAARWGGRWNSVGTEIIYTALNRSLAQAEVAVHYSLGTLPSGYHMLEIYVPDNTSLIEYQESDLPPNWNNNPPPLTNAAIGDEYIKAGRYCLLKIPSAVTQGDHNILINPAHPEFSDIKVIRHILFPFDTRLFIR